MLETCQDFFSTIVSFQGSATFFNSDAEIGAKHPSTRQIFFNFFSKFFLSQNKIILMPATSKFVFVVVLFKGIVAFLHKSIFFHADKIGEISSKDQKF